MPFIFISIHDLAFSPDGSQLIVAAGSRVLVNNIVLSYSTANTSTPSTQ